MKTKNRIIPAKRILSLILAVLIALAVAGISPGAARAEEPGAPDSMTPETSPEVPPEESAEASPEVSAWPGSEPEKTEDGPADQGVETQSLSVVQQAGGDGVLPITMVDGYPCAAGEVLVQFRRNASDATVQSTLASVDGEEREEIVDNLHVVEVPEGETVLSYIEKLEAQPNVVFAQPNYVYYLPETKVVPVSSFPENHSPMRLSNDPQCILQWHLSKIGAYAAWEIEMGSSSVRVAVLDTGADLDHPDLKDRIVAQTDIVDNDGSAEDDDGHGTHVAGIIAATADNYLYGAGVAPGVSLIIVDVFFKDASGKNKATTASIAAGIYYAIDQGAEIINLSLGGYMVDNVEINAIEAAANAGVVVVAAAGNDSTSATIYPGDLDSVICVTATGPDDEFASYSNYGPAKDIAAPGGNGEYYYDWILSTFPLIDPYSGEDTGGMAFASGTSMAAPMVSGVAALMLSADPSLSVSDIKNKLYSSAVDLGAKGKDDYFGHGRVNAASAVRSVRGISTSSYTIDRRNSYLTGVPVETPLSALQSALTVPFGTLRFCDSIGIWVSEGVAKTGMKVQMVQSYIVKDELTIVVKGDVNGDGGLSIADYTLLRLHLLNLITLSPAAAAASDTNSDSTLNVADYTDIRLALLKLKPLS